MASEVLDDKTIWEVSRLIGEAQNVLFITGAGISADSGLPTYRGIGGLYEDQATEEGFAIEDALSGQMFRSRPDLTWKYIHQIESACRGAGFNRGHEVIAEMERALHRVVTLTQNVDGLHRAGGAENVIEIHGSVHDLLCTRCEFQTKVGDYAQLDALPRCPECSGVIRPDVVLFGEMLASDRVAVLESELARGFDIVLSVGTSSLFPYIAGPVVDAKMRGVPTVEINPSETEVSHLVDLRIRLGAASALDAIWSRCRESGV